MESRAVADRRGGARRSARVRAGLGTGRSVHRVVRVLSARASPRGGRAWLWLQEACHGGAPAVEHRRWCSRSCSGLRVLGSSAKEWEGVAGAHRGPKSSRATVQGWRRRWRVAAHGGSGRSGDHRRRGFVGAEVLTGGELGQKLRRCTGRGRARRLRGASRCRGKASAGVCRARGAA